MNPNSSQKRITFGYNREYGKIVIYEEQAIVVEVIFTHYLHGYSIGKIKEILEKTGIPSPQNKPAWGKQAISNILSNPHYIGDDVYPQIITQQQFDSVQTIKASKTY